MAIETPPLLDRAAPADEVQRLSVLRGSVAALPGVPEVVTRLELMVTGRNFDCGQLRLIEIDVVVLVVRVALVRFQSEMIPIAFYNQNNPHFDEQSLDGSGD